MKIMDSFVSLFLKRKDGRLLYNPWSETYVLKDEEQFEAIRRLVRMEFYFVSWMAILTVAFLIAVIATTGTTYKIASVIIESAFAISAILLILIERRRAGILAGAEKIEKGKEAPPCREREDGE